MSNQAPEGEISTKTMVVVKWSEKLEGLGDEIDDTLCGKTHKEYYSSIVPWSGTYLDTSMNCSTW